jgi:3-deoxy-7-phosphoheptulonate synthase
MIIVMKRSASAAEIGAVVNQVTANGYRPHLSQGTERTIIGVVGDDRPLKPELFELLDGVENVVRILQPFKLASRDFHPADTIVTVGSGRTNGHTDGNGHGNGHEAAPGAEAVIERQAVAAGAGTVSIGGQRLVIMAGPCAVESRAQLLETAFAVKEAGATVLRGGA